MAISLGSFFLSWKVSANTALADCSEVSCGDVNQDGIVYTVGDMVYLIRWIMGGISADSLEACGDVNLCDDVNIADLYLYEEYFVYGLPSGICQPAENCISPTGSNAIYLECPENVYAQSFDSVAVNLYITNEVDLGGFTIGITHDSPFGEWSSIDFTNSVLPSTWSTFTVSESDSGYVYPFGDENAILLVGIPDPGEGLIDPLTINDYALLATLWFRYPDMTESHWIDFSIVTVPPAGDFLFAPTDGGVIEPQFVDAGEYDMYLLDRMCGDVDHSGAIDIDDVVLLIKCIFIDCVYSDPWPDPNCDGMMDIDDVVFLIEYAFLGGPPPCDLNMDGQQDYGCGA